jgi:hypothetical protein
MIQNIKTKKIFALVTVVFFTFSLLPIVQVSNAVYKQNENSMPVALTTDELLEKYSNNLTMADIAPVTDVDVCDTPRIVPTDIPELTREEELRLGCFPGYFTPDYITLQDIPSRNAVQGSRSNPQPVKIITIIDTEAYAYFCSTYYYGQVPQPEPVCWAACKAWANNIIEGGDDYMELWYGIDFQTQSQYFELWDSPNNMNYSQLLDVMEATNPSSVGCDTIILITGQFDASTFGKSYIGGHSNVMYAMAHLLGVPLANLFQHESSHMFGCDDDSVTTNCIMNALTGMVNRSYCKSNQNCDGIMKANCTRFD